MPTENQTSPTGDKDRETSADGILGSKAPVGETETKQKATKKIGFLEFMDYQFSPFPEDNKP